jgi:hypothetical protein
MRHVPARRGCDGRRWGSIRLLFVVMTARRQQREDRSHRDGCNPPQASLQRGAVRCPGLHPVRCIRIYAVHRALTLPSFFHDWCPHRQSQRPSRQGVPTWVTPLHCPEKSLQPNGSCKFSPKTVQRISIDTAKTTIYLQRASVIKALQQLSGRSAPDVE